MSRLITTNDKIFVAGHRGMAGSAICRALHQKGYTNLLTAARAELDLEDASLCSVGLLNTSPRLWCWPLRK